MTEQTETSRTETNWQEKYVEFQVLQQHIEQLSKHLEQLNEQLTELEISRNAVEELGRAEQGNEVLAPIADGVFIKTTLNDPQKLVINVGSSTTVEKTTGQVVALLEEQRKKMMQKMRETEDLLLEFQMQAMQIYQEVQKHAE